MKVAHFHFGKEGGAERFFVHLVNSLHERDIEQISVIRPNRLWRKDIEGATQIIESNFRNLSPDRLMLPIKVKRLANEWEPNTLFAWMPRACRLMPGHRRLERLRHGGQRIPLAAPLGGDPREIRTAGPHHAPFVGWRDDHVAVEHRHAATGVDGEIGHRSLRGVVSRRLDRRPMRMVTPLPRTPQPRRLDDEERGNRVATARRINVRRAAAFDRRVLPRHRRRVDAGRRRARR